MGTQWSNVKNSPLYDQICQFVRQVPRGKEVSYGQVARIVGWGGARDVGYALAALSRLGSHRDIPWQRGINSRGKCSLEGPKAEVQGGCCRKKVNIYLKIARWKK
jgi:alkylated DNA nucleotide flippase Atl1